MYLRRFLFILVSMVLLCGLTVPVHATLFDRGSGLIYDDDLDITWYDYTKPYDTWQNQLDWADTLTVNFGGTSYDDWRLPYTVDGPFSWGYDGTTTAGYNITSNELGHLFYTALGNQGSVDTFGNPTGCSTSSPFCLTNTGPFTDLQPYSYWFGTEYAADQTLSWYMVFSYGSKSYGNKGFSVAALAVRDGDVAAVPEPGSVLLLGSGFIGLIGLRKKLNK